MCCGGIVHTLVSLYCRMGCRGRDVAAALTFRPPRPSSYDLLDCSIEEGLSGQILGRFNCRIHKFQLAEGGTRSGNYVVFRIPTKDARESIVVSLYLQDSPRYVILCSHGNNIDIGMKHQHYAELSARSRCLVVGYDYSGYGCSTGSPGEKESCENAQRVVEFLQENSILQNSAKQLILYGESVGSGPAIWLASKFSTCGLILQSPISSGLRVLTSNRVLCCCDIFPNVKRIKKVTCPTFVIHGLEDNQVSVSHGRALYRRLPSKHKHPPWWVEDRGHYDIVSHSASEYWARLHEFFNVLDNRPASQDPSHICKVSGRIFPYLSKIDAERENIDTRSKR